MHGYDPKHEPRCDIRIVDFDPRWRDDFARLNLEWLERWFVVEPIDREVLGDPETHILADGGRVLFAAATATARARRRHGRAQARRRGRVRTDQDGGRARPLAARGIGRLLMQGALDAFQAPGGRELFLESSSKLGPALALYESVGFRHHPAPRPGSHYARADVYMVWEPQQ